MRIVAVFLRLLHLLASLDALLQNRGLDERRKDFLRRRLECIFRRKLHRRFKTKDLKGWKFSSLLISVESYPRLAASSSARLAWTRARCARNSGEAWMSESGATPSATFWAAVAIVVAESSNPRRDDSAAAAR